MRIIVLYLGLAILPGCVFAQRGFQALPLTSFARGLTITDSPGFYLASLTHTRGGSIQGIAGARNKSLDVSWAGFAENLTHDPRPYTFWMQAGLSNDSDSTISLSVDY